jgi:hypothetical protein
LGEKIKFKKEFDMGRNKKNELIGSRARNLSDFHKKKNKKKEKKQKDEQRLLEKKLEKKDPEKLHKDLKEMEMLNKFGRLEQSKRAKLIATRSAYKSITSKRKQEEEESKQEQHHYNIEELRDLYNPRPSKTHSSNPYESSHYAEQPQFSTRQPPPPPPPGRGFPPLPNYEPSQYNPIPASNSINQYSSSFSLEKEERRPRQKKPIPEQSIDPLLQYENPFPLLHKPTNTRKNPPNSQNPGQRDAEPTQTENTESKEEEVAGYSEEAGSAKEFDTKNESSLGNTGTSTGNISKPAILYCGTKEESRLEKERLFNKITAFRKKDSSSSQTLLKPSLPSSNILSMAIKPNIPQKQNPTHAPYDSNPLFQGLLRNYASDSDQDDDDDSDQQNLEQPQKVEESGLSNKGKSEVVFSNKGEEEVKKQNKTVIHSAFVPVSVLSKRKKPERKDNIKYDALSKESNSIINMLNVPMPGEMCFVKKEEVIKSDQQKYDQFIKQINSTFK